MVLLKDKIARLFARKHTRVKDAAATAALLIELYGGYVTFSVNYGACAR